MAFYECKNPSVQSTLLWENPSPSSNLAAGNQDLNDILSSYKYLEVWYKDSKTGYNEQVVVCPIEDFIKYDQTGSLAPRLTVGAVIGSTTFCRELLYVNDSLIYIYSCKAVGANTTNDANLIITKIYGINN